MSRSYKKHPHCSYVCYFSNKKAKRSANRKMRTVNRQIIRQNLSYVKEAVPEDYEEIDGNIIPVDWEERWPVESLDASHFKKMREVSNVYSFPSDGLYPIVAEYEKVWDWSYPYLGIHEVQHPKTTIAEARRNHNWKTLRHFIRK